MARSCTNQRLLTPMIIAHALEFLIIPATFSGQKAHACQWAALLFS